MGTRLGMGATLAAAVVFSSLLVSNAAIFAAAQRHAVLVSQADAESYMYVDARAVV